MGWFTAKNSVREITGSEVRVSEVKICRSANCFLKWSIPASFSLIYGLFDQIFAKMWKMSILNWKFEVANLLDMSLPLNH